MTIIDRSAGKPWRDQRDNTWKPHGSCNVTSYVMAGDQGGVEMPGDENLFLAHMNKPEWYQELFDRFPWAYELTDDGIKHLYPPEQIHELLAEGFEDWTHHKGRARFDMCWTRRELMQEILHDNGVVLPGKFPYKGGRHIKHMVSLAGFETLQNDVYQCVDGQVDPDRVVNWIIDDPYGDVRTEYEVRDGNGVKLSNAMFNQFIRGNGPDCKWAHSVGVAA